MQGSGLRLSAISAVEMALWDIAGKVAGAPVSQLLGGAFRKRVRAYASVLFPEDPSDLASVRETGKRLAQRGFSAVKFGWGGFGRDWRADVALVKAARQAIGDDIDLLVDVGLCWDARTALERAHMLAEFRLYWLEAPMPFYPMEAYAELCSQSPIRSHARVPAAIGRARMPLGAASSTFSCPMSQMSAASVNGSAFRRWPALRAQAAFRIVSAPVY